MRGSGKKEKERDLDNKCFLLEINTSANGDQISSRAKGLKF